jgi:hypothetical protein
MNMHVPNSSEVFIMMKPSKPANAINAFSLYLGGGWFKSQPRQLTILTYIFMIYLGPSRQFLA